MSIAITINGVPAPAPSTTTRTEESEASAVLDAGAPPAWLLEAAAEAGLPEGDDEDGGTDPAPQEPGQDAGPAQTD